MKPGVIDDRDKFMRGVDRAEKNDAILIKTQQTRSMDGGICYFFLQVAALNNSVFKKKNHRLKSQGQEPCCQGLHASLCSDNDRSACRECEMIVGSMCHLPRHKQHRHHRQPTGWRWRIQLTVCRMEKKFVGWSIFHQLKNRKLRPNENAHFAQNKKKRSQC